MRTPTDSELNVRNRRQADIVNKVLDQLPCVVEVSDYTSGKDNASDWNAFRTALSFYADKRGFKISAKHVGNGEYLVQAKEK